MSPGLRLWAAAGYSSGIPVLELSFILSSTAQGGLPAHGGRLGLNVQPPGVTVICVPHLLLRADRKAGGAGAG